jgi:hypothetical protein
MSTTVTQNMNPETTATDESIASQAHATAAADMSDNTSATR